MTFETALEQFIAAAQTKAHGTLSTMDGARYIRVVHTDGSSRSSYCFVDRTNGDVLKSAGWKAPAKGKRSNIYDADHGASGVNEYGAVYFR